MFLGFVIETAWSKANNAGHWSLKLSLLQPWLIGVFLRPMVWLWHCNHGSRPRCAICAKGLARGNEFATCGECYYKARGQEPPPKAPVAIEPVPDAQSQESTQQDESGQKKQRTQ